MYIHRNIFFLAEQYTVRIVVETNPMKLLGSLKICLFSWYYHSDLTGLNKFLLSAGHCWSQWLQSFFSLIKILIFNCLNSFCLFFGAVWVSFDFFFVFGAINCLWQVQCSSVIFNHLFNSIRGDNFILFFYHFSRHMYLNYNSFKHYRLLTLSFPWI